MKDLLTPTYMFSSYREVTPDFLLEHGIRGLLLDIDNTLAPYEQEDPDESIRAWVKGMQEAGIAIALVSNNHPPRVERFNRTLGLPAYADSGKPGKRTLLRAMRELGREPSECAMMGDQLLTDSYAGRHIGLPSVIVPPIKDKTNPFFRFKRLLERPYIRRYAKAHGYADWMSFWRIRDPK
ncbi:MAG: YqeG family HAD IIIA-type phosphatase [Clostridia bacterium]|nr:YqeG family HAD IIIA-type phosphatase [Clostridia bacterium]MBQ2248636.1 YqeG family HAD IIIA-type phosphatase [Clostridia bacterium]MBQ5612514.1 YqeG family HAD IIIA-type phosphatase [Clostridia bacterium]MBQ5772349.1 YqeG family HAD IIIA-type phosphatase [Clostridia bacterium]MBQ5892774.1 YqeG family HAD IIIA-type phosphatase [Clostridia bacterium]